MKITLKRILAIVMAGAMLVTAASGIEYAPLAPEQRSISDATLQKLGSTAGFFQRSVATGSYEYALTLSGDETSFSLNVVPSETAPAARPTVLVDGQELVFGKNSQEFTLAPSEEKRIPIKVTSKDGSSTRNYTVIAYRTNTQIELVRGVCTMADGSEQLSVAVKVPSGVVMDSIKMALKFDPAMLQLANKNTNAISSAAGTVMDYAQDFLFDRTYSPDGVMSAAVLTLDNRTGEIAIQMGRDQNAKKQAYTVPESGEAIMTLYFRLVSNTAGVGLSALDFAGSPSYPNGVSISEQVPGQNNFAVISHPKLAGIHGMEQTIHLPELIGWQGGHLSVWPEVAMTNQAAVYAYGDTISLSASPDEKYRFSHWEVGDGLVLTEDELGSDVLRFRLTKDLDVSSLRPVFIQSEMTLPTGRWLDITAPYAGGQIMAYNPLGARPQLPDGNFSAAALEEPERLDRLETQINPADVPDEDGLVRLDMAEGLLPLGGEAEAAFSLGAETIAEETLAVGARRQFQARDTRYSQTDQRGWSTVWFTLMAISSGSDGNLYLWLADDLDWQPVALEAGQIEVLAENFAQSYDYLGAQYHKVTDSDGNGGLNILMYDIRDNYTSGTGNSYIGGFVNANELYGNLQAGYGKGNAGDYLHLDTYPQLTGGSGVVSENRICLTESTMAHETQHLSLASSYSGVRDYIDNGPQEWVNEGLSLSVEHELFGPLESRINYYNTSAEIQKGLNFTDWSHTPDVLSNYAMSYLFFRYVAAQSGGADFAKRFYTAYGAEKLNATGTILQEIPAFKGKTLDEIMESFYLALYLKENDGVYGFQGDPDMERAIPQLQEQLPSTPLPGGCAIYVKSPGYFMPGEDNGIQYVGVIEPVYQLSTISQSGGYVEVADGKTQYSKGAAAILTAVENYGYKFTGWIGAVSGQDNPLTLVMDGDKSVEAQFTALPQYRLTITDGGEQGTVEVTDQLGQPLGNWEALPEGTTVVLTAKPAEGYRFAEWSGDAAGKQDSITITMDGDKLVKPHFYKDGTFDLSLIYNEKLGSVVATDENGQVLSSLRGLKAGSEVLLEATEQQGTQFSGWGGDATGADAQTRVRIDGEKLVTAFFSMNAEISLQEFIQLPADAETTVEYKTDQAVITWLGHGTITVFPVIGAIGENGMLPKGALLQVRATPAEGKIFDQWKIRMGGQVIQTAADGLPEEFRVVEQENWSAPLEKDEDKSLSQTVEFYLTQDVSMEPVFGNIKAAPDGSLWLAMLRVAAPEGRNLVQRGDEKKLGYDGNVYDYDLYLKSDEDQVILNAAEENINFSTQAEITLLRNEVQVGKTQEVVDRNSDWTGEVPPAELSPLTFSGIQDGDALKIVVWSGGEIKDKTVTYTITLHRTTKEDDPKILLSFGVEDVDNRLYLRLDAKNTEAIAIEGTVRTRKGTMVPVDKNGSLLSPGEDGTIDLTQYCTSGVEAGYLVAKAKFTPAGELNEWDELFVSAYYAVPKQLPPMLDEVTRLVKVPIKLTDVTTVAGDVNLAANDWFDTKANVKVSDTAFQDIALQADVVYSARSTGRLILMGGAVKPQIIAFDRENADSKQEEMLYVEMLAENQAIGGRRLYSFVADNLTLGHTYDLLITYPGYTKVEINGLRITEDVVDLTRHSDSRLHELNMYCGDFDGDGKITVLDRSLLTRPGILGHAISGKDDPLRKYDLDGNNVIQLMDAELVTIPYNLGKTEQIIDLVTKERKRE